MNGVLSDFRCLRLFTLLFLLTGSVEVMAELVWKQTSLKKTVDVRQGNAVFEFRFRNAGSDVVTIESVKSSCSCFSPETEKKNYAAGESGMVSVTVNLNGRTGRLNKPIQVKTSVGTYPLNLDIRIPEGYQLSSRRLLWTAGDHGAKIGTLINQNSEPILLKYGEDYSGFKVSVEEIRSGFEYQLSVTPKGEVGKTNEIITIQTESVGGSAPREYKFYAFVH